MTSVTLWRRRNPRQNRVKCRAIGLDRGASVDHRAAYRDVGLFLGDVPLNKGGHVDWGGSVNNAEIRVVGQKNTAAGTVLFWVQNRQHTWKNVVDGHSIPPVSGQIVIPGFRSTTAYSVQRWTTATPARSAAVERLVSDPAGTIRITVSDLQADTGFKISGTPRPPTGVRIVR